MHTCYFGGPRWCRDCGGDAVEVVVAEPTRAELEEALGQLVVSARREQRIVAKFNGDKPTLWDAIHWRINTHLDDWQQAQ